MKDSISFDRIPTVKERLGYDAKASNSPIYLQIKEGFLTPPIKLYGGRASGIPTHEVDAILAARMAGKSGDEIKALVTMLINKRQDIFNSMSITPSLTAA